MAGRYMTEKKHTKAMREREERLRIPSLYRGCEARDEDGIVSHQEEQLNPNRSSIP